MGETAISSGHEATIAALARDLRPVKRLSSPWQRIAVWLGAAIWLGVLLSLFADLGALKVRLFGVPDMWLSEAGAVLTAILAGLAALQTAVPGRSARWALLPLPAVALWIASGTEGCLRLWSGPATQPEPSMHAMVCLEFLLLVSLPLCLLLGWLLVRACPLRPGLTAVLGGLASAAAAAALLAMIHPFDANAADLAVHAAGILLVVIVARLWGGKRLAGSRVRALEHHRFDAISDR